ncbi:YihY family inner membrane protein [Neisseria yangbaofengii]|uniref:YihY family inner membrane protein n=1 Tax=Neisseria yangbaofengii TaxID=2709396 RepID=UPI0013ED3E4A|nr:YihY family inner membrane protein [Neisseria yangbaofengii]
MPFLKWWQGLSENKMVGFLMFVFDRFNNERVPQVASSLTFTTLLALVPVLTVMLVVVSAFPVFDQWTTSFVEFINRTIVPQGADVVFEYLNQFKDKASKLTAIGSVMLFVTSLMLVQTIDSAFNRIWNVHTQRPLMRQFLVYWALLTFGPLSLGVSLSLIVGAVNGLGLEHISPVLAEAVRFLMSLFFSTALLWALYRFVPHRFVPAKHALIGAVVTAFALQIARYIFAWYMSNFDGYKSIYGAFAAIPFFLVWLNLLWSMVLAGAVLTSSLSYWRDNAFRRNFDSSGRFDDVLKILLLLDAAQQEGKAMLVQELRGHINMGYDELGELLEKLARHGYVYSGKQGWVLKTSADKIDLAELFKIFVYSPSYVKKDKVNAAVDKIMQPCVETMNMTLAEFRVHTDNQDKSVTALKKIFDDV